MPGVKVLGDSENGDDVTAQYEPASQADRRHRRTRLAPEVLARANNVGDILTVHDRITTVQAEIDQLQGQINVLSNQSTFSSISVTLTEKPPTTPSPRPCTT